MPHLAFNHSKLTLKLLTLLHSQPSRLPRFHLNQLHCHLIVSGAIADPICATPFTAQLALSDHSHAATLLHLLPHKSVSIWNTVIRSLCENHHSHNVVSLAKDMLKAGCFPDNFTLSFVLRACGEISDVVLASIFHSLGIKLGWEGYDYVVNGLIHCYVSCSSMDFARKVFDESSMRDVVTWTAVINGYWKIGQPELARKLFDQMPDRNAVSWSAMINGYAQLEMFTEALETFNDMLIAGIRPNQSGLVGALTACTHLGALDQGRWIHAYVGRNYHVGFDGVIGTALIDMYSKCGHIDIACDLFEKIPNREMYPYAYSSLIAGLANHGDSKRALNLFKRMEEDGVCPNEVTFISVLSACSRIGLVEEGLRIFSCMKDVHGIVPGPQHYGCLVDLLGRAGLLGLAEEVVRRMPVEPCVSALGALLNACRVHGYVHIGKSTLNELSDRSLDHSGLHVLLSNIYASLDQWNNVQKVRSGMVEKRVRKVTGCSCIEVEGRVVEFISGDKPIIDMIDANDILSVLVSMEGHLKSLAFDGF